MCSRPFVEPDLAVDDFLDDHVARAPGFWVCEREDETDGGERDGCFEGADGTLVWVFGSDHV